MKIKSYQDLHIWKKSYRLCVEIYKSVKASREFALRDQIQRSAISVPSNIAEGFNRSTNKEYLYFLKVSRGSCAELQTQLMIAGEVGLINAEKSSSFVKTAEEVSAMLQNLIKVRTSFGNVKW